MNNLVTVMAELKQNEPETFDLLQQLAKNARNGELDPAVRIRCASALGQIGADLIMEGLRRDAADFGKPKEPVYEYRFVRGARVKVRVN